MSNYTTDSAWCVQICLDSTIAFWKPTDEYIYGMSIWYLISDNTSKRSAKSSGRRLKPISPEVHKTKLNTRSNLWECSGTTTLLVLPNSVQEHFSATMTQNLWQQTVEHWNRCGYWQTSSFPTAALTHQQLLPFLLLRRECGVEAAIVANI